MDLDLPFTNGTTAIDIAWNISDWGGLSTEDQAKVSLVRSTSDYSKATLTTSGAVSANATVTVQAVYDGISLVKTINLLKEDINAMKATLLEEINSATSLKNSVTDTNPFITSPKTELQSVINAGQTVYDNASATISEVANAIENLNIASTAFSSAIQPYNDFLSFISTIQATHDAETRTDPFFEAIKATLQTAIDNANSTRSSVASVTDIESAKTALQSAYNQFLADIPAYESLSAEIAVVNNRLTNISPRVGETLFLMFPTASVNTLTSAKTSAENILSTATTAADLITAKTDLTNALTTFNNAPRVGTGTSYYRIYTWGNDAGDGGSRKAILFASGNTLKYKENSPVFDPNSVWEIVETTTNKYTIRNIATGAYLNGTSLSANSTVFSFSEVKSQGGNITGPSESYFIYSIINPSSRALEVDVYNEATGTGVFLINSNVADRYRFAYQFEPIATLPEGKLGSLTTQDNWSLGVVPLNEDVVVAGTLSVNQNVANLTNINITSSGKITVEDGVELSNSSLYINSDETGTATLVNNAGIVNVTNANISQHLPVLRNWYMSTPITGTTPPTGYTYNTYDEATNKWVSVIELVKGKGYAVTPSATGNITFSGAINDGDVAVDLTRTDTHPFRGFNLVGNPYPSYITWTGAIAASANTETTIWYRTHNGTNYDFYTYNASGTGIGSPSETTGVIAPMQAFWVRANTGGGTLTFTNSMRSHNTSGTPNLLKVKSAVAQENTAVNQILRLQVTNGTNKDETVLYFNPNASDVYDKYDSPKMSNNNDNVPEVYTKLGQENIVINGMNTIPYDTEIALGFKTGITGTFTIKANEISNFSNETNIILIDKTEGKQTDLRLSDYTFTSDSFNATDRFSILFPKSGVPTSLNSQTSKSYKILAKENRIIVNISSEIVENASLSIYNIAGQLMKTQLINNQNTVVDGVFSAGVYIVNISNGADAIQQKIVVK